MNNISRTPPDQNLAPSRLYCDGGSRGNPGPSASGYVLFDQQGKRLAEGGDYLEVTTNNQAEYQSLISGMEKAVELGIDKLKVYMDSQLAVRQVLGEYKVKNIAISLLHNKVKDLLDKFKEFDIEHIPREMNKEADAIVNQILDKHMS